MRASRVGLNVFFGLCLALICLAAADSIEEIAGTKNDNFISNSSLLWYAVGGLVLGLLSGNYVLRNLSRRTLRLASVGLGSLALIAVAVLIYLSTFKT